MRNLKPRRKFRARHVLSKKSRIDHGKVGYDAKPLSDGHKLHKSHSISIYRIHMNIYTKKWVKNNVISYKDYNDFAFRERSDDYDDLVYLKEVLLRYGYDKDSWWRKVFEGDAPKPIKIGHILYWYEPDIIDWIGEGYEAMFDHY